MDRRNLDFKVLSYISDLLQHHCQFFAVDHLVTKSGTVEFRKILVVTLPKKNW